MTGVDAIAGVDPVAGTAPVTASGAIHITPATRNSAIRTGRAWNPSSSVSGRPKKTAYKRRAAEPANDHADHGADPTTSCEARTTSPSVPRPIHNGSRTRRVRKSDAAATTRKAVPAASRVAANASTRPHPSVVISMVACAAAWVARPAFLSVTTNWTL